MKDTDNILVTCVCVTYNHKNFIRRCLDGMLMQIAPFSFEIIVYDDCSTDGTREIVEEYAINNPGVIRTVFPTENQYSKLGDVVLENFILPIAKGKYVALCEGDDYWTDPQKIQKQAEWMEQNNEYSVTFHRCLKYDVEKNLYFQDNCAELIPQGQNGISIEIDTFLGGWFTQPLSMMFKKSAFQPEKAAQYKHYRDIHQIYHLLENGSAYLFSWVGGVYNLHVGGVAGKTSSRSKCEVALKIARELYLFNPNEHTKKFYVKILQWAVYEAKSFDMNKYALAYELFRTDKSIWRFAKNIVRR